MSYIKYEVHEYSDGTKHWYLNGKLHREDGPAVEYSDGIKHWYLNGKLHREDGPAVGFWSGNKHWYLNGMSYGKSAYQAEMAKRNSIGASSCSGKTVTIDGKEYKLTEIK